MKILAIDSSGLVASVAVVENETLLGEYTVNFKKTHSETLLPMADELLTMVQCDKRSLDAVAVAAGPGSFTGLRIGAATAKGIALALNIPIVEVPTLAALAYNLYGSSDLVCPIMDARRSQVYCGMYRFDGGEIKSLAPDRPLAVAAVAEELAVRCAEEGLTRVIFTGDGVAVYREELDKNLTLPHLYAPAHLSRQRAGAVGALGCRLYERGEVVDAAHHAPIYLRKSQAEQEKERAQHADS